MLGYFYQGQSDVDLTLNHNKHENAPAAGTFINAGDDLTQNSWYLGWEHYFGNLQTIAEYGEYKAVSGMTGATANPSESGAKILNLAVRYALSKRTHELCADEKRCAAMDRLYRRQHVFSARKLGRCRCGRRPAHCRRRHDAQLLIRRRLVLSSRERSYKWAGLTL